MKSKIEELYTNEGKELFDLIQEWIDENSYFLYCKNEAKDAKYYCR